MRRAPLLAAALALLLAGCAPTARSSTLFAMDTVMELTVYGPQERLDEAAELIHDAEGLLSVTAEGSDIALLNSAGKGEVHGETAALLERALEICALTDGALDITVYPLVRAWGFTTGEYRIPEDGEIEKLLEGVDYASVRLEDGAVALPRGALLDLGAVAKGWTADLIAEGWRDAGVKSGLINLGGNVMAVGSKPNGGDWVVGIRDPFSDGLVGAVSVRDAAVVTSGGYQRYFEEDGVRYGHIIDPQTGRPADSGLASVTVTGAEGVLCDGLSTAVYVMGLDAAAELWRENAGFELALVTDGGEIYITEGLEDVFTPMDGYENTEIQVIRRG